MARIHKNIINRFIYNAFIEYKKNNYNFKALLESRGTCNFMFNQ